MDGTARRVAAQVLLLACVLALVATSPPVRDIVGSAEFDLALSAEEPTTEFDVKLEITPEAFEQPFERPLTFDADVVSTIVPRSRPTDGAVPLPTVTATLRPLGDDGEPVEPSGQSGQSGQGSTTVRTADCSKDRPCLRAFRVQVSRHGGGELPVVAWVRLRAAAEYEDRPPDGAAVELRHTLDVAPTHSGESITTPTTLGRGPLALEYGQERMIVVNDGQVVTFTRTTAATDTGIQVAVPNRWPDRSTPGDVDLVPLDDGPRLVVPIGFTADIDPFVGCAVAPPCVREYTTVVPDADEYLQPRPRLEVPDGVVVELGPSTLRVEDVVAEGHQTGTVTVHPSERRPDATIERTLEVVADLGGGGSDDVAAHTTREVWVLLEVEAIGLEEGVVEAHLTATSSYSTSRRVDPRVLRADRPRASIVQVLVNDGRLFDTPPGPEVNIRLERPGGGPVEVRWTLRGVVSGSSSNVPPGSTVRFPPAAEDG